MSLPLPSPRASQQSEEEKKAEKELQGKALALVDEIAAEATSLRLVDNQVYLLCGAADALWPHDERKAWALIREAMNQVLERMREAKEKAAREDGQIIDPRYVRQTDTGYLRGAVLNALAARDAKAALEFIQATRALRPADKQNQAEEQQERALELNLASQVANSDPRMALRIAEESLNGKLDYQAISLWETLQRKDPEVAAALTDRILDSLKSQDASGDPEALTMAFVLSNTLKARMAQIAQKDGGGSSAAQSNSTDNARIQDALRAALDIIVGAAMKVTVNSLIDPAVSNRAHGTFSQIQGLLPDIEKLLPSRAAAVRAKLAQFNAPQSRPPYEAFYAEYGNDLGAKSVQDLLTLAMKAPPEVRQSLYYQAANKAMETGDDETARKVVRENVADKWQANSILSAIERRSAERAAGEGKFADARKLLAKMQTDEQRASALAAWARGAASKGDRKLARELNEEARALVGARMQRRDQLEAQMAIANAAANFDPDTSFEIAGEAIERLNRLIAANQELHAFGGTDEGEMRVLGGVSVGAWHSGTLVPLFSVLARKDFDRTVELLKRWQSNELRLTMSLSIAQTFLLGRGEGYGGGSGVIRGQ